MATGKDHHEYKKCFSCQETKEETLLTFGKVSVGCSVAFHFNLNDVVEVDGLKKSKNDVTKQDLYKEIKKRLSSIVDDNNQESIYDFLVVENFHSPLMENEKKLLGDHFNKEGKKEKHSIVTEFYDKEGIKYKLGETPFSLRYRLKPLEFICDDNREMTCEIFLSLFPAYRTAILSFNILFPGNADTDHIIFTGHLFEKNKEKYKVEIDKNSFPLTAVIGDELAEVSGDKYVVFMHQIIKLYILSIIKGAEKGECGKESFLQYIDTRKNDKKVEMSEHEPTDGKCGPLEETIDILSKKWGRYTALDQAPKSIYCEIQGLETPFISNAFEIGKRYPKQIYGILVRDEGWRYVPSELAKERLNVCWGSRCFFNVYVFRENVLLINLSKTTCVEQYYGKDRTKIPQKDPQWVYDSKEPDNFDNYYYLGNSHISCLNHGILLTIEKLSIVRSLMTIAPKKNQDISGSFKEKIKAINRNRANLIFLKKTIQFDISEISEVYQMMYNSLNMKENLDEIFSALAVTTEELTIAYSENTNDKMELLTVIGLFIAVLTCMIDDNFPKFINTFSDSFKGISKAAHLDLYVSILFVFILTVITVILINKSVGIIPKVRKKFLEFRQRVTGKSNQKMIEETYLRKKEDKSKRRAGNNKGGVKLH